MSSYSQTIERKKVKWEEEWWPWLADRYQETLEEDTMDGWERFQGDHRQALAAAPQVRIGRLLSIEFSQELDYARRRVETLARAEKRRQDQAAAVSDRVLSDEECVDLWCDDLWDVADVSRRRGLRRSYLMALRYPHKYSNVSRRAFRGYTGRKFTAEELQVLQGTGVRPYRLLWNQTAVETREEADARYRDNVQYRDEGLINLAQTWGVSVPEICVALTGGWRR